MKLRKGVLFHNAGNKKLQQVSELVSQREGGWGELQNIIAPVQNICISSFQFHFFVLLLV